MRRSELRLAALLAMLAGALAPALPATAADPYPTKPVRLIVPFPPGGSNDIVGRMIAQQLSERLGQQFIVDNRGGAGGTIATGAAAKSPPDGYTLLLISVAYTYNSALYKQLPYDPATAFVPVAMLGTGPAAFATFPGLGVSSVAELIALAKQKPGALNYASAGVGSFQHLVGELFRLQAGVDVVHVPYRGGGPSMTDVMAGQAQYTMSSLIQTIPHARSGTLKVIATTGAARNPMLPDVPTVAETIPGFEANNWWGILAPTGTPQPILDILRREIGTILASPETNKRFETEGAEAVKVSADEFARIIATDTAKWAKVVKEAGISAE